MRLLQRKPVRALLALLAIVVVAVVAVKVFLPAEKIRDLALAQARQKLGREITVGEVSVSLRGGLGVRLADFAVHNPDGFGGDPLLTTAGLDLKLAVRPLLHGEIQVHRLVLDTPRLNLVRRADGSDNFTFPASGEKPAGGAPGAADGGEAPPPLSVASLTVSSGRVAYTDEGAAPDGMRGTTVDGLALGLSLDTTASGAYHAEGRATAERLAADASRDVAVDNLVLDFSFDTLAEGMYRAGGRATAARLAADGSPGVAVDDLAVDFAVDTPAPEAWHATGRTSARRIAVTGPGQVPELDAGLDFDLTWDGGQRQLDLARVAGEVLGLPLAAAGTVAVADGGARGSLRVQMADQPLARLKPFLPADLQPRFTADGKSGTVSATADLTLTGRQDVPVHTRAEIRARDVDLALAQPFLPPGQKGRLAGRGDVAATVVDTTGNPDRIDYRGTATVREASYTESGLVDELQKLDGRVTFTPTAFVVEQSRAVFASGTFDLTGRLDDPFPYFLPPELQAGKAMKTPRLGFALHAKKLDVDRLIPAASPTGAAAPGAGPGMTRKSPVPDGVEFPDIVCDGTVAADTVVYMQVPLTQVKGQVKVRDRRLSVQDVTAAVYRGTVAGQVDIDLNDLQRPAYSGNYAARNIEVNDFMTRFAGLSGVLFGACNFGGDFAAAGFDPEAIRNSLTLDADALVAQGKVVTQGKVYESLHTVATKTGGSFDQEQALRDLATHVKVQDGRVGVSELTTRLGRFADVTVDGSYAFAGDLDYRGTLLLTETQTAEIFARGPMAELAKLLGSRQPARLRLPISVGGTRTDPKVKIELDGVVDELQKLVVKEQGQKLEDEAKQKVGDLLKKWKK